MDNEVRVKWKKNKTTTTTTTKNWQWLASSKSTFVVRNTVMHYLVCILREMKTETCFSNMKEIRFSSPRKEKQVSNIEASSHQKQEAGNLQLSGIPTKPSSLHPSGFSRICRKWESNELWYYEQSIKILNPAPKDFKSHLICILLGLRGILEDQ